MDDSEEEIRCLLDPAQKKSCPGEGAPQQEKWKGGCGPGMIQEDLAVLTSCQKGALRNRLGAFQILPVKKHLFDRKYLAGSQPHAAPHSQRSQVLGAERWGGP